MGVKRYNGVGFVTSDELNTGLATKLDAPATEGTAGQIYQLDDEGNPGWADPAEAGQYEATITDSTNAPQAGAVKTYVDNNFAKKDGYYEQLVSGAAKNLEAPITVSDTFLTRPTGGEGAEVADGVAQILEAEGNSIKYNQLVDSDTATVTVTSGHKYYSRISGTASVATSTGTAISVTGGSDIVIDLTAAEIDDLTTAAEVEDWLAKNIGAAYPYNAGTVLNNCMEGIEAPGYNLLDPATGKSQIIGAYSDLYGNYYGIVGTHGALTFTDAYGNSSTITPDSDGKFELTVPGELSVASAGADCAVFLWWDGTKKEYEPYELNHGYLDVKHIYGKLNGEGDLVQVYAAGMARVGNNKDYLHNVDGSAVADKVIGSRAYTSGDESDSTVITDGTTTYYHLTTELRYTNLVYQGSSYYADGTPVVLPVNYKVSNWSIESILPKNTSSALVTAPPVLTCKYSLGAVDLLNTHTDEIADLYATKADTEGSYPGIISGNLVDVNGTGTDQEFVYRPTGGGEALAGNGNGVIQAIKGRTLVWNQLISNGNFANGKTGWMTTGFTSSSVTDGILTLVSPSEGTNNYFRQYLSPVISGHKYLISAYGYTADGNTTLCRLRIYLGGTNYGINIGQTGKWVHLAGIYEAGSINSHMYDIYDGNTSHTSQWTNLMCIDLTVMFGAGNEPSTVAEFEALFNESYYAYNAGTLLPFKGTGIKTTGVNQWDEQWETGQIDPTTGEPVTSGSGATSGIRPTNFIPVIHGNDYCFYSATVRVSYLFLYDNDKNFIQAVVNSSQQVFVYTIPRGVAYIKFHTPAAYGATYKHDICINLSAPSLNGTYKPYTETLVNIDAIGKSAKDSNGNPIVPFPEGMNGTPTVYDTATKVDGIKVMGVVDLGNLTWSYSGDYFYANLSGKKEGIANIICAKYSQTTEQLSSLPDKSIRGHSSTNALYIKDTTYTDAATFKAAMAGVPLVYELATPVPFTWDTPLDLIYPAPEGGTEMLLPQGVDESGVPATTPMDATIFYSKDYVQTINDMPKDFDTTASIDALATALATTLSTALDGTFTITRGAYDATNKKYAWTVTFTPNAEEE